MPLFACGGCVTDLFVTDEELVERFSGKELFSWGRNTHGNLGDQTAVSRSSPVQTISGGTNWKYVEAGKLGVSGATSTSSASGIKTDGTLWLWGSNCNGTIGDRTLIDRSSPVQTFSGGTNWKDVSLSSAGIAGATKTDGTLWLWGFNNSGQLGDNSIFSRSSPVQTFSAGTNWKFVDVSNFHVNAIKTDGTLWTWGYAAGGRLGNNTTDPAARVSSPIQTASAGTNWRSASGGNQFTVATKTDGTLWSWGCNQYGQLGLGNIIDRSSPLQMASNGTMWRSATTGAFHVAGIKVDGTLWVWGVGSSGRLGLNNIVNVSSPVQTISGGTNWRLVRAAHFNTRAIKTDGTLWTWGSGFSGLNGDNTQINRSSPVQTISGGTNWRTVSSGSYSSGGTRGTEF